MDRRRTLATLLPTLALALSACSGGTTSTADPTPTFSSPPSSSATKDPPAPETPEHFIRRWAAAEKTMENTGKTADYLAMSQRCKACRQLASDVSRFYAAGGFIRWGGWQILSIGASGGDAFRVSVDSAPTVYRETKNGTNKHLAGGKSTHQISIRRSAGTWLVLSKAQVAG